jgi:mono/diheme cytochrome c family protein
MKRIEIPALTFVAALTVVFTLSVSMHAQDAPALYKSKCAACHGADGTASSMGKKMGAHDFSSPEVQKMSDAELSGIITNGKDKMPKYASLSADDVKGLVAYIRALKK